MYELIYRNNVKIPYCSDISYNSLPTPFTIITEEEWRHSRHMWVTTHHSHHQVYNEEQLKELFGEDVGRADAYVDYNSRYAVAEVISKGGDKQNIVYVKIGCDHEYEVIDSDRISYTQVCKKCGVKVVVPTGV